MNNPGTEREKGLHLRLPFPLWRALKVKAINESTTLQAVVLDALWRAVPEQQKADSA